MFKKFIKGFLACVATVAAGLTCFSMATASDRSLHYINPSTQTLDSAYSWSYQFLPGVTTVTYGGFQDDQSLDTQGSYPASNKLTNWIDSNNPGQEFLFMNLNNCVKEQPWVRYNNVGTWNGQVVDMKFIVCNWETTQEGTLAENHNYPTVAFNKNRIQIAMTQHNRRSTWFKIEFINHATGQPMPNDFKWHFTVHDIDGRGKIEGTNSDGTPRTHREKMWVEDSYFDKAYVTNNNTSIKRYNEGDWASLFKNDSDNVANGNADEQGSITFLGHGNSFLYMYEIESWGPGKSRAWFGHAFTPDAVAPFNAPNVNKAVNKELMYPDEEVKYFIRTNIPKESKDFYYDWIKFEDQLPSVVKLKTESYIDVTIERDDGKDMKGYFNFYYNAETGKVMLSAKDTKDEELYGHSFCVRLTCTLRNPKGTFNQGYFENTADLTTRETRTSNKTKTNLKFKVTTNVINGTISPNQENIPHGEDRTITYSPNPGHMLKRVTVDGKDVDISIVAKSYSFLKINGNHHIEVEYQPIPTNNYTVMKVWNDNNDTAKKRPAKVTAILKRNGTQIETKELNSSNSWKAEWKNLPATDNAGNTYTYSIDEADVGNGYEKHISQSGNNYVITNTLPTASKSVDKTSMYTDETLSYTVGYTMHPYTDGISRYVVEDTLPSYLTLTPESYDSITFTRDDKTDMKGSFNYSFDKNTGKLTLTAKDAANKELYGHSFTVKFNCKLKDPNATFPTGTMTNTANISAGTTITTNPVTTNLKFRITTEVVNGTISEKQENIPHGDNRTISYSPKSGYLLNKITVDGKEADITAFKDKYDFSNIQANHHIKVEYLPIPTTAYTVNKVWNDNNDAAKKRPAKVTAVLKRNGTQIETKELNAANSWSATWSSLPTKDNSGNDYSYTIDEAEVGNGYQKQVTQNGAATTITNTLPAVTKAVDKTSMYTDEKLTYTVSYTMQPYQAGIAQYKIEDTLPSYLTLSPESYDSITVTRDDKTDMKGSFNFGYDKNTGKLTLSAKDVNNKELYGHSFTVKFTCQLKDPNGTFPTGTMQNTADINAYTAMKSNTVTTNLKFRITTEVINGTISEKQENIPHGESRTISYSPKKGYGLKKITVDGKETDIKTFKDKYDFSNIQSNHHIKVEYQPTTNASVSVEKVWNDNNDYHKKRPEKVTVILKRDGTQVETKELNAASGWKAQWSNLRDTDDNGKEYVYTVDEADVGNGYEKHIRQNGNKFIITNSIPGIVKAVNKASMYTDEELTYNIGITAPPVEETYQQYKVEDTLRDDVKLASDVASSVKIQKENGTSADSLFSKDYNTQTNTVTIEAKDKTLSELYGTSFNIEMKTKMKSPDDPVTNNNLENTASFTTDRGTKRASNKVVTNYHFKVETEVINGTISESKFKVPHGSSVNNTYSPNPGHYLSSVTADDKEVKKEDFMNELPFTNINQNHKVRVVYNPIPKRSVGAEKIWKDDNNRLNTRPESITVVLNRDGKEFKTAELSDANEWKTVWEDLDDCDDMGNKYEYTVDEKDLSPIGDDSYIKTFEELNTSDVPDRPTGSHVSQTIVNTLHGPMVKISGEKIWINPYSSLDTSPNNPSDILDTPNIGENNGNNAGESQDDMGGNTGENGDSLITPQTSEEEIKDNPESNPDETISGNEGENEGTDTNAPDNDSSSVNADYPPVTIQLIQSLPDGTQTGMIEKVVTAEDGWKYDFGEFDKYTEEGVLYTYTVVETKIGNENVMDNKTCAYDVSYEGWNVINTYNPPFKDLMLQKFWKDNNNAYLTRPESVTALIYQNEAEYTQAVMNDANGWKTSVSVPVYDINQQEYTYSVEEMTVDGYTSNLDVPEADSYVFTNTLTEIISLEGEKVWRGDSDADRPNSITVRLMANGEEYSIAEVSSASNWQFSFDGVNKYDDEGVLIDYSITEDEVQGYTTSIEEFVITNTKIPSPERPATGLSSPLGMLAAASAAVLALAGAVVMHIRRKRD